MKKIGIIANTKKQQAILVIKKILRYLKSYSIEPFLEINIKPFLKAEYNFLKPEEFIGKIDILITIGGDGTLLRAISYFNKHNVPILGINTGKLGFINEFLPKEINILKQIIKGEYKIDSRVMLEGKISRDNKEITKFSVLNDIVITKEALARIIKLETYIPCKEKKIGLGQQISSFAGDGLIVATSTGSTAHSLSAGGPIIHPSLKTFVLTPICPHTLTVRPLIVSSNEEVWIKVTSDHKQIYLTLDGQRGFALQPEDIIKVKIAKKKLKLIISEKQNFYAILQQKLKWG